MGKTKNGTRYSEELRARAVRMVLDHESEFASRSAAILSISQTVETDTGKRDGVTTAERDLSEPLERHWSERQWRTS
jgi:transposase-like protein